MKLNGNSVKYAILKFCEALTNDLTTQPSFKVRRLYFFQVFRLLRSLRPLRVINRAPGLKLVVQTLLSSLRPIGNIVLICCTFFIIFGILGVQVNTVTTAVHANNVEMPQMADKF